MKITVLFPTQTEASLFQRPEVNTVISGVGLTATAYSTFKAIQQRPDIQILAGIAGVFPQSPFQINDVVLVNTEVEADLGFFTPSGFVHLAHLPIDMAFERRHVLTCEHLPVPALFPMAKGISVNAAMAPFIDTSIADVENMEGAAFFYVCRQEQQKFLEIRAISNHVDIASDQWDMQSSIQALTNGLHKLIDHLQK